MHSIEYICWKIIHDFRQNPEYSTGQCPVPFTQISFQTWKFQTESSDNPSSVIFLSFLWFLNWSLKIWVLFRQFGFFRNRPDECINCHGVFCIMGRIKVRDWTNRNSNTSKQGCKKTRIYPTLAIFHRFTCFHELFDNFDSPGSKIQSE